MKLFSLLLMGILLLSGCNGIQKEEAIQKKEEKVVQVSSEKKENKKQTKKSPDTKTETSEKENKKPMKKQTEPAVQIKGEAAKKTTATTAKSQKPVVKPKESVVAKAPIEPKENLATPVKEPTENAIKTPESSEVKVEEKQKELSPDEAVQKVWDYLKSTDYSIVDNDRLHYDHTDGNTHVIQFYESYDDHIATINWYNVDIKTGKITPMFEY